MVGALIGKKIIANEFLAYADLGSHIQNGDLQVIIHTCIEMRSWHAEIRVIYTQTENISCVVD